MKTTPLKMLAVSAGVIATLAASGLALAAKGFSVTPEQEATVKIGMTTAEVRAAIGRPAHSLKFRKTPGGTWIYDVNEINIPATHTVFYVDFGTDLRVTSTSERLETNETEF
jgi:outer membrane protein assembly factor BamE (lipoprotein component of BamABCDE complex)